MLLYQSFYEYSQLTALVKSVADINGRNDFRSHDRRSCVLLHDGRDDYNVHQDYSQDFLQAVHLQLRLHFLKLRRKDGFQPGKCILAPPPIPPQIRVSTPCVTRNPASAP